MVWKWALDFGFRALKKQRAKNKDPVDQRLKPKAKDQRPKTKDLRPAK
jgi:hypothetical protein